VKHTSRFIVIALLTLSFGLSLTSAVQKSPTMDEQNHIARGAAYLGTGDPRLSIEHPPLVNALSALPAHLLLDLNLPLDQWWEAGEWYHFADNFLWYANQNPDRIVFLARLPIIALGMMLSALVFRWASERFGSWGGLLASVFCAFDPNILAHMRLSTTDVGGAFFIFLAAYAFWKVSRKTSSPRVLWAGVALGMAFAAKLSALLFGPILALTLLIDGFLNDSQQVNHPLRRIGLLVIVALLALIVIWVTYCFQMGPLEGVRFAVPAPPYVRGIRAVLSFASGGRQGYLFGEISTEGWWYYFPIALIVKTPLVTLTAILLATAVMLRYSQHADLFLLVPPSILFTIFTIARLNLGYRHLLPILPFLAVHIGRLAPSSTRVLQTCKLARLRLALPVILVFTLTFTTFTIYPHFLAYFNLIGGGPKKGWHILADSNIDWGQDLKGLRSWMKRQNIARVRLSWFGSAYPEAYSITYDPLPGVGFPSHFKLWSNPPFDPEDPQPGVYVISVNNLIGLNLPNPDLYAWFRNRLPDERIGYSLFVYRVHEQ
jgi:hypothetical protein